MKKPDEIEILARHPDGRILYRAPDGETYLGWIVACGLTREEADAMVEAGRATNH